MDGDRVCAMRPGTREPRSRRAWPPGEEQEHSPVSGTVDIDSDGRIVGEWTGSTVSSGDTDGDGVDEVFLGSTNATLGGPLSGAAFLVAL